MYNTSNFDWWVKIYNDASSTNVVTTRSRSDQWDKIEDYPKQTVEDPFE